MPKKDIHPKWFTDTKVKVNGEVVMTVSSTREELNVDLWSGNHPFFTGSQKVIDTEGRIERFLRKFDKNNVKKRRLKNAYISTINKNKQKKNQSKK